MFIIHFALFITFLLVKVLAVPPAICREEFRWDDCGAQPQPVVYYWKKGSRCEIGIWKGCLPNPNMFANEYECINTCIFQERPAPRTESDKEDESSAETDKKGDKGDTSDDEGTNQNDTHTATEQAGTEQAGTEQTDTTQTNTTEPDTNQNTTESATSDPTIDSNSTTTSNETTISNTTTTTNETTTTNDTSSDPNGTAS